jgi:hypothetical protein
MPASHEKPFKVFYSWQSDLPEAANLKLIRNALSQAANVINADHGLNLHVMIDEATREVPGSPNIADSIFTKIRESDVFVCDLSKVAEMPNEAGAVRKYCNPNAALELGYAVRVLGWNRIIIVFNEGYGVVPDDLPFDARGHRTSTYRCKAELDEKGKPSATCQSQISNSTGILRTTFVDALKLIANDAPKRPQELEVKAPEVIQRERDIEQLKDVFYWINVNMLDRFITGVLNARLRIIGLEFCDFLGARINSAGFHLYDVTLQRLIVDFYQAWKQCGNHANSMDANNDTTELRFRLPMDTFVSREQEKQYNELKDCAIPLRQAFDALLNYVRSNYLKIDLAVCGMQAVERYLAEDE